MEYLNPVEEGATNGSRTHSQSIENSCSEPPSLRSQTANISNETASRAASETNPSPKKVHPPHIRIAPHIVDVRHCLYFDVIDREIPEGMVVKVGRFTDKVSGQQSRIAFKSKVVSRSHAEIWTENGTFFIKDTKSSSGTFLNHMRLSPPGVESSPFPLKDGDILQLGVDYQGGTLEVYKCVKIRVEINRKWQRSKGNNFRKQILKNIQNSYSAIEQPGNCSQENECCICLYNMLAFQALFVSPCSHCFHFKCVKQLLFTSSGFSCPLCRTYADLEASISEDEEMNDAEDDEPETNNQGSSNFANDDSNPNVGIVENKVVEITNQLPIAVQIVQNQMSQSLAELSRTGNLEDGSNPDSNTNNSHSNINTNNPLELHNSEIFAESLRAGDNSIHYDNSTNVSENGDVQTNVSENEDFISDSAHPVPTRQETIVAHHPLSGFGAGASTPISTINQLTHIDHNTESTPVGSIPATSALYNGTNIPENHLPQTPVPSTDNQPSTGLNLTNTQNEHQN